MSVAAYTQVQCFKAPYSQFRVSPIWLTINRLLDHIDKWQTIRSFGLMRMQLSVHIFLIILHDLIQVYRSSTVNTMIFHI